MSCFCALAFGFVLISNLFGEESAAKNTAHKKLIQISTERLGTTTHLFIENVQAAPVIVTFEMELTNLDANVKFPLVITLPGNKKVEAFSLTPKNPDQGWSWTYHYHCALTQG